MTVLTISVMIPYGADTGKGDTGERVARAAAAERRTTATTATTRATAAAARAPSTGRASATGMAIPPTRTPTPEGPSASRNSSSSKSRASESSTPRTSPEVSVPLPATGFQYLLRMTVSSDLLSRAMYSAAIISIVARRHLHSSCFGTKFRRCPFPFIFVAVTDSLYVPR